MISRAAFAQQAGIRVITPDSEHIYSADGPVAAHPAFTRSPSC
jgi:hypothetical protein